MATQQLSVIPTSFSVRDLQRHYSYDEQYVLALDKKAQAEHKAGKTKKLSSLADLA